MFYLNIFQDINARISKSSLVEDDALRAFSIVGSFFSMLGLVITIITLLVFRYVLAIYLLISLFISSYNYSRVC